MFGYNLQLHLLLGNLPKILPKELNWLSLFLHLHFWEVPSYCYMTAPDSDEKKSTKKWKVLPGEKELNNKSTWEASRLMVLSVHAQAIVATLIFFS